MITNMSGARIVQVSVFSTQQRIEELLQHMAKREIEATVNETNLFRTVPIANIHPILVLAIIAVKGTRARMHARSSARSHTRKPAHFDLLRFAPVCSGAAPRPCHAEAHDVVFCVQDSMATKMVSHFVKDHGHDFLKQQIAPVLQVPQPRTQPYVHVRTRARARA